MLRVSQAMEQISFESYMKYHSVKSKDYSTNDNLDDDDDYDDDGDDDVDNESEAQWDQSMQQMEWFAAGMKLHLVQ